MEEVLKVWKISIVLFMTMALLVLGVNIVYTWRLRGERDEVKQAVKDGYEFYLDGYEVDPDNIKLSAYRADINHGEHKVVLWKSEPSRRNYTPIIVPIVH